MFLPKRGRGEEHSTAFLLCSRSTGKLAMYVLRHKQLQGAQPPPPPPSFYFWGKHWFPNTPPPLPLTCAPCGGEVPTFSSTPPAIIPLSCRPGDDVDTPTETVSARRLSSFTCSCNWLTCLWRASQAFLARSYAVSYNTWHGFIHRNKKTSYNISSLP